MLEPRFLAELAMVVVIAASLSDPPVPWALAPPLAIVVTPAAGINSAAALAVAAVVACIGLAAWSIFDHNAQSGIFVSFAVFATAALPDHMGCIFPDAARRLKL